MQTALEKAIAGCTADHNQTQLSYACRRSRYLTEWDSAAHKVSARQQHRERRIISCRQCQQSARNTGRAARCSLLFQLAADAVLDYLAPVDLAARHRELASQCLTMEEIRDMNNEKL